MTRMNACFPVLSAVIAMAAAIGAQAGLAEDTLMTAEGPLTIQPMNHATFVMQWNEKTIYVDPVGGAELFADTSRPDLILITHIHGDHTDAETLKAISTKDTAIVAPATVVEKLGEGVPGRLTILANGETFEQFGILVEAVPAYNLTEDRQQFHPKGRDNGYVVTLGGKRIYISGDTEDIPEMRSLKSIDVAFVCMNLPYTMTVEHGADAVLAFAPKVVYPYHYRGQDVMSDLEEFARLVDANDDIDVRLLEWY